MVLLGSGDFCAVQSLTWLFNLSTQFHDARWRDNGELITLQANDLVETWDSNFTLLGSQSYADSPVALVVHGSAVIVITANGDGVQFTQH